MFRRRAFAVFAILLIAALIVGGINCTTAMAKDGTGLQPFKVAAVQFNPVLNEREKNVTALLKAVEEAFQNGARLVVAPEMSTTGYYYKNRASISPFVDTIPGDTTARFAQLTRKYDAYLVFGLAEVDSRTGLYYNAAALVGPAGYIGKYRKTHQWESEEHWAAWGDLGVPVYNTRLGRIAINICMDSAYFETARLAALGGADILAFPTNSSAQAVAALPARAIQNGLFIVSANRTNTENGFHMIGASAVWSPAGKKLAEAPLVTDKSQDIDGPTIIYAQIDPREYVNANKLALSNRRPALYKELMLFIGPWDYTKNTVSHDVTAAALQYRPVIGDKEANKAKVAGLVAEAVEKARQSGRTLNLVVLPELALTGPVDGLAPGRIAELAEFEDGDTFVYLSDLAAANKVAIVCGFAEKSRGKLYNAAMLLDKDGSLIGKYRKTHLSDGDRKWAGAGGELPVFAAAELGRVGILVGDDAAYPEAAGVLSVKRADIIAIPSAWRGQFGGLMTIAPNMSANKYPEGSMISWDAVAMGAQAYTIAANFVGTDGKYLGRSGLFTLDPLYGLDQPVVASGAEEEALIVAFKTLQSQWWFNQEMLVLSRRTPYYVPLVRE